MSDTKSPAVNEGNRGQEFDAIVVGAGFSGPVHAT